MAKKKKKGLLSTKTKLIIIAVFICVGFIGLTVFGAVGAVQSVLSEEEEQRASSTSQNASEIYRNTVLTATQKYQISEYSDIILSMIRYYMNYSLTDVMDVFEVDNSTPEVSIDVGTKKFAEIIKIITNKTQKKPIENNSLLLIALETYEINNNDYISFAISRGGHSIKIANLFKKSNSVYKKDFDTNFAAAVLSGGADEKTALKWQKTIADITMNYSKYSNITVEYNRCLMFVDDVYSIAGLTFSRSDCAACAGAKYGVSNDWTSIPLGAAVYCQASQQYGHVGIYVGSGKVMHSQGGEVITQSLMSFVAQYKGKCWGFEGVAKSVYPPKPEAFGLVVRH